MSFDRPISAEDRAALDLWRRRMPSGVMRAWNYTRTLRGELVVYVADRLDNTYLAGVFAGAQADAIEAALSGLTCDSHPARPRQPEQGWRFFVAANPWRLLVLDSSGQIARVVAMEV